MKTTLLSRTLLAMVLCLSAMESGATIRRVNNRPGLTGVYTTAQIAHDNALPGDTLMLEPSQTAYGNLTLLKKLVVIGTGYFLTENPETQYKDAWPSTLGTVSFAKVGSATSEFSELMGVICTGTITISVPNITLRRNHLQGTIYISHATDPVSNVTVAENYCTKSLTMSGTTHSIVIRNNLFVFPSGTSGGISGGTSYNGLFMNNVLIGTYYYNATLNVDNFIVQNNICSYTYYYPNYNTASNNLADNAIFGNQNGNQQNVIMSSVFLYSGSTDGQYRLKTGSPAIAAGNGGVDCGAYGGSNPYVLSGMPPVPATYFFNIGDPSGPYNVQVKIKSHN